MKERNLYKIKLVATAEYEINLISSSEEEAKQSILGQIEDQGVATAVFGYTGYYKGLNSLVELSIEKETPLANDANEGGKDEV